ncbi:ABC transporter ATP-binding protein/permease [Streptomyces tubbatahanensis]|uniref:ABC transporter ATP-binding protein/permease n=1 Tax=Streptomyces tubbatahanensis TaxID=2923272 RepID=A0ABY3XKY2_9ACTN|nr:ABC transporter ATP-binding protein [Streptomyces tubbatahanensis]UNS95063.1 ABC transporter ATP-binding protein/permease [Streptomyces tubbatahanensis]
MNKGDGKRARPKERRSGAQRGTKGERSGGAPAARAVSLIGTDEFAKPTWAAPGESAARRSVGATLRAVPGAITAIVRLSWRASPALTVVVGLAQLLAGAVSAYGLIATANVLTTLLSEGPTPDRVIESLPALLAVVASLATRALMDSVATVLQGRLRPRIMEEAQDAMNSAVVAVELKAFDDPSFRELIRQGIRRGMPSIDQSIRLLAEALRSAVTMVSALVATAVLSLWLLPVMLLAAFAEMWSATQVGKLDFLSFLHNATRQLRIGVVQDLVVKREVAAEVRAYRMQEQLMAEHRRVASQLTDETVKLETRKGYVQLMGRALSGLSTGLAYVLLGFLLHGGVMPLALAGTAVLAMRNANTGLATTMRSLNRVYELSHYIDLYHDLLAEAATRRHSDNAVVVPQDPAEIRIDDVAFSYPGSEQYALRDINLCLRRGEVVALVGENGSGKSTLSKIITGLYRPVSGAVLWDGVDLATATEASVLDQVALISQEPARWPMTAGNNIRVGRLEDEDASGERWSRAVTASGAEEVVDSLPNGAETILSKEFVGGRDLSGGQWQRIGVARGVYRDAALLVADEPTAALDAKAEAVVFEGLRQASSREGGGSRTTLLVTHRLVNVRRADRIVVLHQGRVVEQGTHAELTAAGGRYADMYALQADAYTTA